MCCSFRRNIDAMTSKFLSKNKCNYLQHHFIHNYKFSMSNKNNGMPEKITVKQSGHCVTGLSHDKLGWKSCIFCSLTPQIAAILLAPPPPVTAGRRASGSKHPAHHRRLIETGADYYPSCRRQRRPTAPYRHSRCC